MDDDVVKLNEDVDVLLEEVALEIPIETQLKEILAELMTKGRRHAHTWLQEIAQHLSENDTSKLLVWYVEIAQSLEITIVAQLLRSLNADPFYPVRMLTLNDRWTTAYEQAVARRDFACMYLMVDDGKNTNSLRETSLALHFRRRIQCTKNLRLVMAATIHEKTIAYLQHLAAVVSFENDPLALSMVVDSHVLSEHYQTTFKEFVLQFAFEMNSQVLIQALSNRNNAIIECGNNNYHLDDDAELLAANIHKVVSCGGGDNNSWKMDTLNVLFSQLQQIPFHDREQQSTSVFLRPLVLFEQATIEERIQDFMARHFLRVTRSYKTYNGFLNSLEDMTEHIQQYFTQQYDITIAMGFIYPTTAIESVEYVQRGIQSLHSSEDFDSALQMYLFMGVNDENGEEGHANAIVIDSIRQTIVVFEPNGRAVHSEIQGMDVFLNEIRRKTNYTIRDAEIITPRFGPQSYELRTVEDDGGYCAIWSIMFMHCYLLFPEWNETQIVEFMMHGTREDANQRVRGYLMFLMHLDN